MTVRQSTVRLGFALSLLVLAPLAAPARAAADDSDQPLRGDTTSYTFEDELVKGDGAQPDGEVLHVHKRSDRTSLIRVRTHFMPELFKTSENL